MILLRKEWNKDLVLIISNFIGSLVTQNLVLKLVQLLVSEVENSVLKAIISHPPTSQMSVVIC